MPVLKSSFPFCDFEDAAEWHFRSWLGVNITGLESPFFLVFISIISGKKHLISLSLNFKDYKMIALIVHFIG